LVGFCGTFLWVWQRNIGWEISLLVKRLSASQPFVK
jgi:hypothetical protein